MLVARDGQYAANAVDVAERLVQAWIERRHIVQVQSADFGARLVVIKVGSGANGLETAGLHRDRAVAEVDTLGRAFAGDTIL